MLEKDIENLIANYPKEFFPKEELTLIKQQYSIDGKRIDILFKDKFERKIIIEVKRGILSREASGQIVEYYGLLKNKYPDDNIELVLCANVIPNERKSFLERVGVECKEVSVRFITELAEKYNYIFADSHRDVNSVAKNHDSLIRSVRINEDISAWIFQANPERYDILNALADEKIGNTIHWLVNQHKMEIKKEHIGIIWMSGKDAGIYAITKINTFPELMNEFEEEKKYWFDGKKESNQKMRVEMTVLKRFINQPIFRKHLVEIEGLKKLSILCQPQGTNFPVKKSEWEIISKIAKL